MKPYTKYPSHLGMFTIGKIYGNKVMLNVPYYTMKSLHLEYISRVYEIDQAARYEDLARAMECMQMEKHKEALFCP